MNNSLIIRTGIALLGVGFCSNSFAQRHIDQPATSLISFEDQTVETIGLESFESWDFSKQADSHHHMVLLSNIVFERCITPTTNVLSIESNESEAVEQTLVQNSWTPFFDSFRDTIDFTGKITASISPIDTDVQSHMLNAQFDAVLATTEQVTHSIADQSEIHRMREMPGIQSELSSNLD